MDAVNEASTVADDGLSVSTAGSASFGSCEKQPDHLISVLLPPSVVEISFALPVSTTESGPELKRLVKQLDSTRKMTDEMEKQLQEYEEDLKAKNKEISNLHHELASLKSQLLAKYREIRKLKAKPKPPSPSKSDTSTAVVVGAEQSRHSPKATGDLEKQSDASSSAATATTTQLAETIRGNYDENWRTAARVFVDAIAPIPAFILMGIMKSFGWFACTADGSNVATSDFGKIPPELHSMLSKAVVKVEEKKLPVTDLVAIYENMK